MFLKCAALIAGLAWATTFQAAAQPAGAGQGRGMRGILTQDQSTQLREATQADLAPLREKLAAAQKEAVTAALAENPSEATVKAKLEAVSKIQNEMALLRFRALKKINLTGEQKTQLSESPMGYMTLFGGGAFGGFGGARGTRGGRSGGGQ
jgi:Spy/CpxP family protein refolding chaperone